MNRIYRPLKWLTFTALVGTAGWIAYPAFWRVLAAAALGLFAHRVYTEDPKARPAEELSPSRLDPDDLMQVEQRMVVGPAASIVFGLALVATVWVCALLLGW